MPLEQTEPTHHADRGKRPHALLPHKDLSDQITDLDEIYDPNDPSAANVRNFIDELIREYQIRQSENKIEPGISIREARELMQSLPPSSDAWVPFRAKEIKDYEEGVGPDPYSGVLPGTLSVSEDANWRDQPFDRLFQDMNRSEDVFEQAWGITKMALVRDSIESEDEDDFYRNRAVFQDRDDPSKQYPMETYNDLGGIGICVRDTDNEGRLAARAYFNPYENRFSDVGTNVDYRRKGMMTAIYDLVNEIQRRRGRRLKSDARRLSDSSAPFWAKALGLPYEGHAEFQRKYGGQGFEWPEEGVYE